jgi:hypothetical protein
MQAELIRSVKGLIDTMHRELKNFVERGRKMSVKKLSKQNVFKSVQLAFDRFITNLEDYAIGKNSTNHFWWHVFVGVSKFGQKTRSRTGFFRYLVTTK